MTTKNSNEHQLISSSEAPLASHSLSKDSEKDWLTHVVTWPSNIYDLLTSSDHAGSSGKTSPTSCALTEAGILLPSSGAFKSLVMGSPHECWTLDISESPKSAVESTLSDILETGDLPPQCFLSPAACQGVLNRSVDKRYKVKLSPRLRAALEKVASRSTIKKDETSQNAKESPTP